ncbi:50S ribosomal protein L25 [Aeoliella sp.]|uniref:50S ribosomal protein L25 n=1 Tax=Aeoliella sp. TaxID=2795800 RepID=UPI003CCBAC0B
MSETLTVKKRDKVGTRASDRLRAEGLCPAVLYGHNEPSVSLAVPYEQLSTTLRHGAKVVDLAGDEKGQALLQDLQWDTFGRYVLHADLLRVAAGERVTVEIGVEGKGEAPGEAEGGVMTWVNHAVEIEVTPANIPEKLHIDLSEVHLGDTVTASAVIDLPEGATLVTDPTRVLLNCVAPQAEEEEETEAAAATGAEPELVGKKGDDEESSDE